MSLALGALFHLLSTSICVSTADDKHVRALAGDTHVIAIAGDKHVIAFVDHKGVRVLSGDKV